jgi:uncharacterized protein (UPF0332 family)
LLAAEILFKADLYNASANRAYYAVFHAAFEILIQNGLTPEIDHRNVFSLLNNELINRKKIYPSKLKEYFNFLQDNRNKADYNGNVSKDKATKQLKRANEIFRIFIKESSNDA